MPLLNDQLTVWELAFRWAGYDPAALWLRIPLAVRDNIRLILNAIHLSELECFELTHEKWHPDTGAVRSRYIGNFIEDVTDCIEGRRYKRSFLRQVHLDRDKVHQWCNKSGLKFPEFWLTYPVNDAPPEQAAPAVVETSIIAAPQPRKTKPNPHKEAMKDQARQIWAKEPHLTKCAVAKQIDKLNLQYSKPVNFKTLQEWIADLDPRPPEQKRGRKRRTIPV